MSPSSRQPSFPGVPVVSSNHIQSSSSSASSANVTSRSALPFMPPKLHPKSTGSDRANMPNGYICLYRDLHKVQPQQQQQQPVGPSVIGLDYQNQSFTSGNYQHQHDDHNQHHHPPHHHNHQQQHHHNHRQQHYRSITKRSSGSAIATNSSGAITAAPPITTTANDLPIGRPQNMMGNHQAADHYPHQPYVTRYQQSSAATGTTNPRFNPSFSAFTTFQPNDFVLNKADNSYLNQLFTRRNLQSNAHVTYWQPFRYEDTPAPIPISTPINHSNSGGDNFNINYLARFPGQNNPQHIPQWTQPGPYHALAPSNVRIAVPCSAPEISSRFCNSNRLFAREYSPQFDSSSECSGLNPFANDFVPTGQPEFEQRNSHEPATAAESINMNDCNFVYDEWELPRRSHSSVLRRNDCSPPEAFEGQSIALDTSPPEKEMSGDMCWFFQSKYNEDDNGNAKQTKKTVNEALRFDDEQQQDQNDENDATNYAISPNDEQIHFNTNSWGERLNQELSSKIIDWRKELCREEGEKKDQEFSSRFDDSMSEYLYRMIDTSSPRSPPRRRSCDGSRKLSNQDETTEPSCPRKSKKLCSLQIMRASAAAASSSSTSANQSDGNKCNTPSLRRRRSSNDLHLDPIVAPQRKSRAVSFCAAMFEHNDDDDDDDDANQDQKRLNALNESSNLDCECDGDAAISATAANSKLFKVELYKTELCRNMIEFCNCPFGSDCRFAHYENELRPLTPGTKKSKYKTAHCNEYDRDICYYGKRCWFIHREDPQHFDDQLVDEFLRDYVQLYFDARFHSIYDQWLERYIERVIHSGPRRIPIWLRLK